MSTIPPSTPIGELSYGSVKSKIYWYKEHLTTVEILELKHGIYLVRGSKQYMITDLSDPERFHSKLQEIGVFSDYLKEKVPSFSLSMFYISSLTSDMISLDSSPDGERVWELKRSILQKEGRLASLKADQEAGIPIGREAISLEAEINKKSSELSRLTQSVQELERATSEYLSKGHGVSIVIKSHTPSMPCKKSELGETISLVLKDVADYDNVIKNRARHGFHLILKELENPSIAYSSESLGIFQPAVLDELVKKYPEISDIKEDVEKMFIHRWAKEPSGVSGKKSSAIAQGVATLLRRATERGEEKGLIKEPKWDKLPSIDEKKRQGFLGYVKNSNLQTTKFPLLFDYDDQALQHCAIIGASGWGKTVTAYDIAEGALFLDIPVIAIDPSGQWSGFLEKCEEQELLKKYRQFQMKEPISFPCKVYTPGSDAGATIDGNLLARPDTDKNSELEAYARDLSFLIKDFCKLTDNETVLVNNYILEAWKKKEDLSYTNLIESQKPITKMKLGALNTIDFLFEGDKFDISTIWESDYVSVISLSELTTDETKLFASYYFLREITNYFNSQDDSNKLKLLLVVEEAHHFKNTSVGDILSHAAKTLRKKGVGLVFVTQTITDIAQIRANTTTKIYMNVQYDPDIKRVKERLGSDAGNIVSKLKKGEALIEYPNYDGPIAASIRPCFHKNTKIPPLELKKKMLQWKKKDVSSLLELKEEVIIEESLSNKERYLNEILIYHQNIGQWPRHTDVMQRLGWKSERMGMDIKKSLIKEKKIKEEQDPTDKRAKRLVVN